MELQENLLKAAKSLSEGRSSLEEFVFTLKDIVGTKSLVEAVGIGKGKHDLTGTVLDPARSNQVIPIRPEIPVGKACSSLTSGDIIKFLTGGFRLSKAKSNDLFWEAVWPRLLARGWHSEQPKYLKSVGSKNSLVFVIPGINKFSRKKLTKGSHYFDSVSDVLNKVASDPSLLELDFEGAKGSDNYNDECGWNVDAKLDHNRPDQQRHCYLRPKVPNSYSELVKFTVVDTSVSQGEGPSKVRALQSLPVDAIHSSRVSTSSGDADSNNSEELADSDVSPNDQRKSGSVVSEYTKFGNTKKCIIGKRMHSDPPNHLVSVSKRRLTTNGHDSKDQDCGVNDKQLIKDTKCQYSRRVKSGEPKYLEPVSRRQRLTGCKYAGDRSSTSLLRGHQSKKEDTCCKQKSVEVNEIIGAEVGPSKGKPTSASVKGSVDESRECDSRATGAVGEAVLSQEKRQPSTLFDLNIPQFPLDFDTNEPFCTDMAGSQDGFNPKEPPFPSETKQHSDVPQQFDASNGVPSMQQPTNNARRHSTRNRPPTTKALEALACGFLSPKRKGRGTKTLASDDLASRPNRRPRRTVGAPLSAPTTNLGLTDPITSPKMVVSNTGVKEEYTSATNGASVFAESHAWSERKDRDLLGVLYCSEVLD